MKAHPRRAAKLPFKSAILNNRESFISATGWPLVFEPLGPVPELKLLRPLGRRLRGFRLLRGGLR